MDKLLHYLNESPTIFFILKKESNWQLEYVTQNVTSIYGFSAEDFLSKRVKHEDFIHQDDLEQFVSEAKLISKTIKDKYFFRPYRIIDKDRKIVWVNHIIKIIRDKNGNTSHYYGYLTDITVQKTLYSQLEVTQNILDSTFNNSFNSIILLNNSLKILKANKTSLTVLNVEEKDILGEYFWDLSLWNTKQKDNIKEELSIVLKGSCLKNKKSYIDSEANQIYVDLSFTPVFNDLNEVLYVICEAHDITQTEITRKSLNQYVQIVNENILISVASLDGSIIDISDAYCSFTGYTKKELLGKKHNIFRHPDSEDYIFRELWETITKGEIWKGEHQNIKKDGSMFWVENAITPNLDENGKITAYTSIYNDITDKKEISRLLITDYLTKIYNRRHFNTIFDLELKRNRRDKKDFVLMFLDVDYFKQYNDTYGHDEGDIVLHDIAQCLKYSLKRSHDYVFRLGGEEFGIITSDVKEEGALVIANNLRESIRNLKIEHKTSKIDRFLTISIGIKIVEASSTLSENDIYKLADMALYKAKEKGRNTIVVCTKNSLDD